MRKKHFLHRLSAFAIVLATLLACSNASDEFCRRPCYVIIDNSTHLDATLASAMNVMSPGIFCMIQKTQKGGATYYHVASNQAQSSDIQWNAKDQKVTSIVGMNNGIIVGFGNIDNPAVFYAYDRECPNCFDPDGIPVKSRPLTLNEKGHATCGVCARVYDMNNRGYVISGEGGKPLNRYPASTSGPYGVLAVQ